MSGNRKLGKNSAQRKAMLRGMVTLLLKNGKIEPTYTRAKEVSAVADSMITLAKQSQSESARLAGYRRSLAYITEKEVARKLFNEIAPSYEKLAGGYTQLYKLGPRRGDAAEMALVRLIAVAEEAPVVEEKKPAKKKASKKAAAEETPAEAPAEEKPADDTTEG